jgi:hypothetical protein
MAPAVLVARRQGGVEHLKARRPAVLHRLEVELRIGAFLQRFQRVGPNGVHVDGRRGGERKGEGEAGSDDQFLHVTAH